ncbi:hypothetical protein ACFVYP_05335 [Kitasatospora sp. NPDC058201]|uniref:hypothetical protein n=1 Tax=unclassified Kitasatospora TaxID=2633591 RepID=UPI0036469983
MTNFRTSDLATAGGTVVGFRPPAGRPTVPAEAVALGSVPAARTASSGPGPAPSSGPAPAPGPGPAAVPAPGAAPVSAPGAAPLPVHPGWTPGAVVERLAAEHATGALRGPAGTVYLVDGLVTHAESDRTPDLATLLTACGRLTPAAWQEEVRRSGPYAGVGEALVEQGRLTRGELELCHLGALYDAACFLLDAPAALAFRTFAPGVRHWLGPVAAVGVPRLRREAERRRILLDRIWPWPQLDTAPVRPAARLPAAPGRHARRIRPPSRYQRDLLDHADGRRTPAELARLLGRSAFATTVDVRRLAAAGLLLGPGAESEPGSGAGVAAGSDPGVGSGAGSGSGDAPGEPSASGGLHRRVPGAALAALAPAAYAASVAAASAASARPSTPAAHPLTAPDPDIALLIRVRTLLEARL